MDYGDFFCSECIYPITTHDSLDLWNVGYECNNVAFQEQFDLFDLLNRLLLGTCGEVSFSLTP